MVEKSTNLTVLKSQLTLFELQTTLFAIVAVILFLSIPYVIFCSIAPLPTRDIIRLYHSVIVISISFIHSLLALSGGSEIWGRKVWIPFHKALGLSIGSGLIITTIAIVISILTNNFSVISSVSLFLWCLGNAQVGFTTFFFVYDKNNKLPKRIKKK